MTSEEVVLGTSLLVEGYNYLILRN